MNIVRFSHSNKTGGGLEQYIWDLNHALCKRYHFKIFNMYLSSDPNEQQQVQSVGNGAIHWHPMMLRERTPTTGQDAGNSFVNRLLNGKPVFQRIKRRILNKAYMAAPAINHLQVYKNILDTITPDLLVIHSAGCFDSDELISESKKRHIPIIIQNHYINSRLLRKAQKRQVALSDGIAGVSGIDIPKYLRGKFINLSDGIDTDFFCKENVRSHLKSIECPIIFLPARMAPSKGHIDVIDIVRDLKLSGINSVVGFAGRSESIPLENELRRKIKEYSLDNQFMFLGELEQSELRKWYADSSVVVLPSGQEGLGRVLLEAQSMEIPVVAYNVGGVAEALIPNETGFLVQRGDIKDFTEKVAITITNKAKARLMGTRGREYILNKFSSYKLAERHERFYRSIIQKRLKRSTS